jgi:hypothetical protein
MLIDSAKRYAPATLRNREPIRKVLREVLPEQGQVLEVGAGSGEHAVFFAAAFPAIVWQPTDADLECLASIAAWTAEARLANRARLCASTSGPISGPALPSRSSMRWSAST